MSVADELKRQGYELEYEYGDSEDHTEVWTNKKKGMAVKGDWIKVEEVCGQGEGEAASVRISGSPLFCVGRCGGPVPHTLGDLSHWSHRSAPGKSSRDAPFVTPASQLAVMGGILPAIATAGSRRASRLEGGVTMAKAPRAPR